MEHVGVDILGPFLVSEAGNGYILIAMDYSIKWPEAYMIPNHSVATMAGKLVEEAWTRSTVIREAILRPKCSQKCFDYWGYARNAQIPFLHRVRDWWNASTVP